jgi:hypothetical protein
MLVEGMDTSCCGLEEWEDCSSPLVDTLDGEELF